MSPLELELLKAEADEAAAHARVEVFRRAVSLGAAPPARPRRTPRAPTKVLPPTAEELGAPDPLLDERVRQAAERKGFVRMPPKK